ncbi:MAG TPA: hypothetical protein VGP69_06995 [Gaiellaceae bacterium]|jgi:hypothetical protein|nr:hypothetical protein [Gaiellaceae bacterium]
MTYRSELRAELRSIGFGRRLVERVVAEVEDHLHCDPQAQLGPPRLVAERFSLELGTARTRLAARASFGSLALAALILLAVARAIGAAGGYPSSAAQPWAVGLSALGMVAFGQIAFVAGVLTLVRGLRRDPSGADLRLVHRRAFVALAAGALTSGSLLLHALELRPMPIWWTRLAVAGAAVSFVPLAAATVVLVRAVRIAPAPIDAAAGLSGDLPRPLQRHAAGVLVSLGLLAAGFATVSGAVLESSGVEGLVRGAIEGVGLLAGVAVLGRRLGLRR